MNDPLPRCETLTIDFKSDTRRLPDNDLVENVAMANTQGAHRAVL
jgi:hypothetical protein